MIRRLALSCAIVAVTIAVAFAQSAPLEGLSFQKKMKLAKAGDDVAQMAVAMHYELGDQTKKDAQQAARWYREATLKGNIDAQYRLAKLISKGAKGLTADKIAAATLFQAAAERGHGPSQNEIGLRYQAGDGVEADMLKAAEWYQKAADQGFASAEVNLGLLRVRGQGVARDYALAVKLFESAVAKGDAWAMNNLGSMYEMGWGVPKDVPKARDFYRRAVILGNQMAQANLTRLDSTASTTLAPAPATIAN